MTTFANGLSYRSIFLCFFYHQWKHDDPVPESWFDLYRYSPCVPIDYPTIPKALSIALAPLPLRPPRRSPPRLPQQQQVRAVRILLRPGKFYLSQAIEVQALPGVTVSVETMEMPKNLYRPVQHFNEIMEQPLPLSESSVTTTTSNKRAPSFRSLFSCHRQEATEETDNDETDFNDWNDLNLLTAQQPKHATMVLRSRRHNEPAFRVRQGALRLKNVEIQHNSLGLDIWSGNAAVQIQPPMGEDDHPIPVDPPPTVSMERVHISSKSGRGIVNIDGGQLILRQCAVTDCAATGVYIGGPGSHAIIERSDVIRNGVGNRVARRGIARGHSGIYLEQGVARIRQSNVSDNTLTGISVVSPDNAFLTLEESTLMCNGTYQLELPPLGTASRQRSVTTNNTMAIHGEARVRSGLNLMEPISVSPQQQPMPPLLLLNQHPLPLF